MVIDLQGFKLSHFYRRMCLVGAQGLLFSVVILGLVGCGPCAALRREWDDAYRTSMTFVSMGERVALSTREHARLVLGTKAFGAMTALELRDRAPLLFSRSVQIPASSDTRGGIVGLDFDLRFDHVVTQFVGPEDGLQEVELIATLQTHARFEIPGLRSRWSWSSNVHIRGPLSINDDRLGISIDLRDGEVTISNVAFPWNPGAVPSSVEAQLLTASTDFVQKLTLSELKDPLLVASIAPLALPRLDVPFAIQSIAIDEITGSVSLSLVSALRPDLDAAIWSTIRVVPEQEVYFSVVTPVLDAAIRQQSLRAGAPNGVLTREGIRWQALWAPRGIRSGVYQGDWLLWCLDAPNCKRRTVPTELSVYREGQDWGFLLDESEIEAIIDSPETALDSPASLMDLVRATALAFADQPKRWMGSGASVGYSPLDTILVEFRATGLEVRFLSQ